MTNETNAPSTQPAGPAAAAASPPRSRLPMGILIALFLLVGIVVAGVRNVPGGMVGVSVNNFTGEVSLADRVGLHFTIPYVVSFYTIDRTTKQLDMLASSTAPSDGATLPIDDFLNVKAKDGDNVRVDVKVQYNVVPEKAVEVLRTSGSDVLELMKSPPAKVGDDPVRWKRFERKWIWPVVRAALVDTFNELTREQMNEGLERVAKADEAATAVNKLLRDRFGVEVTLITVENPNSYQQYELIVRQRKDTDQEVSVLIQEQATELASQNQQIENETRKAEIARTKRVADNAIALREAEADRDKKIRAAEGFRQTQKADADLKLEEQRAIAEGKRKQGEADAEKIRGLVESLAGNRGAQLISAEFAKRLKEMTIQAMPFIYNGVVQPYLMQQGPNLVPNPMNPTPLGTPTNTAGGTQK